MSKLVAVTGATGFVGPHLVAALARHGWKIRLLVRRWSPLPSLAGVEAELVFGDLDDEQALRRLVEGCDAVVHAAGLIKARHDADFFKVNRDGTARLSALAGDRLFVLLSSLAAREPELSPYAESKRAAEEALAGRSGPWIAVRAPAVYGPGDRETLSYFKTIARGWAPYPMTGDARLSLIHVTDLAEVLARSLSTPPRPSIYEIDDGRAGGHRYADMAHAAASAMKVKVRDIPIPRMVLAGAATYLKVVQALGGATQILTAGKVAEMFHPDWVIHSTELANHLGFVARYDLHSGFADTVEWYRAHKWL